MGREFDRFCSGGPDMPKAARISAPVRASAASSARSNGSQFVMIALFCGIGLLVSLVAIIMGVPGVEY
jgi:hypothetical protein